MKYVFICTVIGFVAGLPLTLLLARKRPTLAWWLAIGSNMPTLVMLLSLLSGDCQNVILTPPRPVIVRLLSDIPLNSVAAKNDAPEA